MTNLVPCGALDYETRLYKGCGASELFSITASVACSWVPLALIAGNTILSGQHALYLSFAIMAIGTVTTVVAVAHILRKVKQGKPEGWHVRKFYCLFYPMLCPNLILKSGCWSTSRDH